TPTNSRAQYALWKLTRWIWTGRSDLAAGAVLASQPARTKSAASAASARTGRGRIGCAMARVSDREDVMTEEIVLSSHFGHAWGWEGRWVDMAQLRGVTARRRKRTAALASASRSPWSEVDQRDHHQPGGFARVHPFELAPFDALAQDRFEHHAYVLFMNANSFPTELYRGQNDVVNTLFRKIIFFMIGKDFQH